jgi:hypothetical protein
MIFDTRLNAQAIRLWCYLRDCERRKKVPETEEIDHIAGRRPYSKEGVAPWKKASKNHVADLLGELEEAGYLKWDRGAPIHRRFETLTGE